MNSFIKKLLAHVRAVAKEDVRLFFAPFVGTYKGIKKEFNEIEEARQLRRKNECE
jgi:hypothetical protein